MNISDELIFRAFLADRSDLRVDGAVDFVRFDEHANYRKKIYGFNSRMLFGRIVYSKDGHQLTTESLAIKQTPTASFDRIHCQLQFLNEIHFFTKVLPFLDSMVDTKVDALFPKFLYSFSRNSPTAEHTAMVFENLRDQGFVEHQCCASILLDYSHLSLVMRRLGHFHGHSLAATKLNPSRFQQVANLLPRIHEYHLLTIWTLSKAYIDYSVELMASRDQGYTTKLEPLKKISQNTIKYLNEVNEGSSLQVFCHGDLLATNLLFRYENGVPVDVRALDMGLCRLASPILDLAHVLYVCADQQTRDRHWDDLIADYRRGIVEIVGSDEIPSMKTILEEFKKHCWYEIMVANHCLRDQQARFEKSIRFLDVFGGMELREYDIPSEEFQRKFEENEFGGTVATEMVCAIIKDMVARNFI